MSDDHLDQRLAVMRERAMEARKACYNADVQEAGSDLAVLLCNCERLLWGGADEIERLCRERDKARGGMITLAKEGAELRMALGSILKCWPLGGDYLRNAISRGEEVWEQLKPKIPAEFHIPYRSKCQCPCHNGTGRQHIVACCQPDPEVTP